MVPSFFDGFAVGYRFPTGNYFWVMGVRLLLGLQGGWLLLSLHRGTVMRMQEIGNRYG